MTDRKKKDRDETVPEASPGDFVGIKLWATDEVRMTPNDLHKVGWPNRFLVCDVLDLDGEIHLMLDPCCKWMVNRASGQFLCHAHPARYFEKIEAAERTPSRNDRYFGISTPLGEIASVDFMENDHQSTAVVNVMGKPVVLQGKVWKELAQKAVEKGLL